MENFSVLHDTCVKVFTEISKTTNLFVLPLFMARVVFSSVMGEGSEAFKALKGVIIYFVLVAGFPFILELLFSIPESFLPKFESFDALKAGSDETSGLNLIPFAVDHILEVILAGLYWVVYYLHVFFMIIMASMAPIVFVTSTLLGVGLGIEIFFGLLIIGSSWPIIWHGFDQVHSIFQAAAQADEFGMKCLEVLVTLLKGVCPVVFASLAVKSPAGQAVAKGAAMATGGASMLGQKGIAMSTKAIGGKMNNSSSSGGTGGGGVMRAMTTNGGGILRSMGIHGGGLLPGASRSEGLKKVSPEDLERVISQNLKRPHEAKGEMPS